MPTRPPLHRPTGQRTKRERDQQVDQRRGSARKRGYDSRWDKARKSYLSSHPLCVMCEREGRVTAATVVDHIKPHRGDQVLFWDAGNWQPLCKPHHDGAKQREEARGHASGCGLDGRPMDPGHPWNRV
ncbi:HNH endonuclease signature motif containing protein [Xanthobacter sp. V2C-8]|uniref:HNH endonuclease signature motif containing protein n=1 Tax=Xanthobacter albus TaxID=3119929 RepID=UPI00372799E7